MNILKTLEHADSWLIYLLLLVLLFFIVWFFSLFGRKAETIQKDGVTYVKRKRTLGLFSSLFVLILLALLMMFLVLHRTFTVFSQHELVAIVECKPTFGDSAKSFELVYTSMVNDKSGTPMSYDINGEKWLLGGDILEWQSFMYTLGFKSMYRLTRIQGSWIAAEDERLHPVSAHALVEKERHEFWEKLYIIVTNIPLIKSVHQNYVSSYPFYGDTFHIYVTTTGYTLERFE